MVSCPRNSILWKYWRKFVKKYFSSQFLFILFLHKTFLTILKKYFFTKFLQYFQKILFLGQETKYICSFHYFKLLPKDFVKIYFSSQCEKKKNTLTVCEDFLFFPKIFLWRLFIFFHQNYCEGFRKSHIFENPPSPSENPPFSEIQWSIRRSKYIHR